MEIPDDKNAEAAFEATCRIAYEKDDEDDSNGSVWDEASEAIKELVRRSVKGDRLRHFMEEGEAKVKQENGLFVCESGYAFRNVVEETKDHKIYRCDGGHHFGVIFVEHKEREGSTGHERKYVIRNGELVEEDSQVRNEDQLELD